jgi:transcriptional regulator with PAS, ATPase and Fis domain
MDISKKGSHDSARVAENPCVPTELVDLKQQLEMMKLILDSIHNGVMITDANGYITHFNRPYGEFLGVDPVAQIGKHCTKVIENTRMHIVAKTGVPEINQSHLIKGQRMVVQRIPIKKALPPRIEGRALRTRAHLPALHPSHPGEHCRG